MSQQIIQNSNSVKLENFLEIYKSHEDRDWIIEDLLPLKSFIWLSGHGKIGKTFLALQLSLAIACGKKFLHFQIEKPRKVIFIEKDMDRNSFMDRLYLMAEDFNDHEKNLLSQNFFFKVDQNEIRIGSRGWQEVLAEIKKMQFSLLIIDPFSRIHNEEENSQQKMQPILDHLSRLAQEYNLCLLVIHHHSKMSSLLDKGLGMRGSSSFLAIADGSIEIKYPTEKEASNLQREKYEIVKIEYLLRYSPSLKSDFLIFNKDMFFEPFYLPPQQETNNAEFNLLAWMKEEMSFKEICELAKEKMNLSKATCARYLIKLKNKNYLKREIREPFGILWRRLK